MNYMEFKEKRIVGLEVRTTNEEMKAVKDLGELWQIFMEKNINSILGDSVINPGVVYGVYFNFEKDHTKPYSFIAGVEVKADAKIPEDLSAIKIPEGNYTVYNTIEGELTNRVGEVWGRIWNSDKPRSYHVDFELYDYTKGQNPEVKVFIN